jgi:hypothetical protein
MLDIFRKFITMTEGNDNDDVDRDELSMDQDDQSKALKVMKFLEDFKANDRSDGDCIYEKNGTIINKNQFGNGFRYVINKDLVVDASVFRNTGELYFHIRKKFPKDYKRNEAISFKASHTGGLLLILKDATETLKPQMLGKDGVDNVSAEVVKKLMNIFK